MSWYNTEGNNADFVLFSKVKYIRNISKMPFYQLADPKGIQDVTTKIDGILSRNGFKGEKIANGRNKSVYSLAEKQFVDLSFINSELSRTIYLNEPCNLLVLLGGKNFISIQSILPGQAIADAKNTASGAEEMLDCELDFAYHDKLGYLSPNIYECGSGLEFSSALFLPSIRDSNSYEIIRSELSRRNIFIYPLFNTNPDTSGIYIVKYSPSYLADENIATDYFVLAIEKIIEFEKQNQSIIYKNKSKIILDNAHRALGTLLYSQSISEDELLSLTSAIRLSRAFCSEENTSTLPSSSDLNFLITEGLSNSILINSNTKCSSVGECNELRSKLVKQYIKSKNNIGIEVI